MRAAVLAGEPPPDAAVATRLARYGVAGLARWPGWQILARQAAEPRWTGDDPGRAALERAYQLIFGGRT